jgi:hypothetical protein
MKETKVKRGVGMAPILKLYCNDRIKFGDVYFIFFDLNLFT